MSAKVLAVSSSESHTFSKPTTDEIHLQVGRGVVGDAHNGVLVKHRSRVKRDPTQPNLRQVHLIHRELHEELREQGFELEPGDMGENITTVGIDLLGLPVGARLQIGADAIVEVTGLRNPCSQLDDFKQGLMGATLDRDADGNIIRKAGIMSIVIQSGDVKAGDTIEITLPDGEHKPLGVV